MTEYTMVSSQSLEEFLKLVNDLLEQGWELYGTPFVTFESGYKTAPSQYMPTNYRNQALKRETK